jgi:RES domain-containing protein
VIEAWRLEKEKYVGEAFTGDGARRVSGRWHHQGIPIVYVSGSLELSILEKFVHLGFDASRIKFVYFKIEIPDTVSVEMLDAAHLSPDWSAEPPTKSTKNIGADWARTAKTAVLRVPSVLAPHSWNYLLNPVHPEFKTLVISSPLPYKFDPRMRKTT